MSARNKTEDALLLGAVQKRDPQERLMSFFRKLALLNYSLNDEARTQEVQGYLDELRAIYSNGFRHEYAPLYGFIKEIDKGRGKQDSFIQNLSMLRDAAKMDEECLKAIYLPLFKLCDYLKMEVERWESVKGTKKDLKKVKKDVAAFENMVSDSEEKITKLQEDTKPFEEIAGKISKLQTDFITILGIFAAIVLAFTAGLSFSSSILANIDKSSIYRLTLVALIIGLVLLNIIFAMFRYVDQLIHDSPRVTLLWAPNIVILLLIIAVVVAWCCGAVEKRNVRIEQNAERGCSLSVDITP